jgi:hypothetical protein
MLLCIANMVHSTANMLYGLRLSDLLAADRLLAALQEYSGYSLVTALPDLIREVLNRKARALLRSYISRRLLQ